ncbi:hypothetical protein L208DRAFT_1404441 [Tricholoma matsutake]|nr:hypothetical protein L208DRAFT_1404441 [Tricholoma matsutake 945]
MVLSTETGPDAHPYWYARVLGVFHAKVMHSGPKSRNRSVQYMEFLWVRWYGIQPGYCWGLKGVRLPKIGFIPDTNDGAFGFIDPSLVIRGCHLVPCFASGRTLALLQTSTLTAARRPDEVDDWANFYVMIFVDRDMFMRYLGGGIGHSATHIWIHDNNAMDVDQEKDIEEEAEPLEDKCFDEVDDEGGGTDDDTQSEDGEPTEDDFGPEDGEDEGYINTGYGSL